MKAPISRFTIHGNSMSPSLREGQDIISFNWAYCGARSLLHLGKKPKVGDIVVIKVGDKEMIKRIQNIRDREVFVEGDNKEESTDSRDFGPVKMEKILGKVIFSSENHPERLAKDL